MKKRKKTMLLISFGLVIIGGGVALACTGMVPTPCCKAGTTITPTQCMNGNQGTINVTTSCNSPSQCKDLGGGEPPPSGGADCNGQTNQVACITTVTSYLLGCGSFSNYQSKTTTNLINQTTPSGSCP